MEKIKNDIHWKKTIILFVSGMGLYLHRLSLIPNCLFRLDSNNIKRFCPSAIPEGLIGPLRSIYLALKYRGLSDALTIFKELFLSFDNPIIIFSSIAVISTIFL